MIRAYGIQGPVRERAPHGVQIGAIAERRLSHPERGIGPLEPIAREMQVERTRLRGDARLVFGLRTADLLDRRAGRDVHEIRGDLRVGGVFERGAHGDDLGLDRA